MNRVEKFLWIVVDLLFLIVFGTLLLIYFPVSNWNWDVRNLQLFILGNNYFGTFIFGLTFFLFIAFLVILLLVIFYPKSTNYLEVKTENGDLTITKRAIEGFVASSINKADFVKSPKVNAHLYKKTVKIRVSGDIKRTSDLIGKQEAWARSLEMQLKNLLGVQQSIAVHVKLKNTAERQANDASDRETARVI